MSSTPEHRNTEHLGREDRHDRDSDERLATADDHDRWGSEDRRGHDGHLVTPHEVHRAEHDRYGGIKFGSAFFGWLSAMGMAVILTALLAAAGAAVGVATGTDPQAASSSASQDPTTVGWVGAAVLAVIVFVSYYCGGYVAGRMARFDGAKQGLAVWLWAVLVAVLVAFLGAVAGSKFNLLQQLNGFPRIPVSEGTLTTAGIIALVLVALTSLLGAVLGGLAGMAYHRKVDRAGVEAV